MRKKENRAVSDAYDPGERLLDAVGGAEEEYVREAGKRPSPAVRIYNRTGRWLLPAAACLCVIAVGAAVILSLGGRPLHDGIYPEGTSSAAEAGEGVTIPKMTVSVPNGGVSADMIAFFIYQGRSYSEYVHLPAERDIIGEHLGRATGSIDEWTSPDDYVEYSGSISGDFYAVKGYPKEFLLCMRMSDGNILVFMNDNGFTISKGSDIFEERMKLSERFTAVRYQSDDSWFYGKKEIYMLDDPRREETLEFIRAIDEGEFILRTPDDRIMDGRMGHFYFDCGDGVPVNIILYDGGYVQMVGLYGVYVKCDADKLNSLLSLFESGQAASFVGDTDRLEMTYEDCLEVPYLGRYVPHYVPADMEFQYAWKSRVIDAETGAAGGVKSMELSFGGNGSYSVIITDETLAEADSAALPVIGLEAVTLEDVEERTETRLYNDGNVKNVSTAIAVRSENVVITVYAYGMDANTVYEIIKSIS